MPIYQKNKKITLISGLLMVVLIASACAPLSAVTNLPFFNSESDTSSENNPVLSADSDGRREFPGNE